MNKSPKSSLEVRERAVRTVQEHRADSPSLWAAIESDCAQDSGGARHGRTTDTCNGAARGMPWHDGTHHHTGHTGTVPAGAHQPADQGIRGAGHPARAPLVQPCPTAHADWEHPSGRD